MNVRTAVTADLDAIAAIHVESWRAAYRGHIPDAYLDSLSVPGRRAMWAGILARSGPGHVTVAEHGFCYYGPTRDDRVEGAEIYALYVEPGAWRKGIGRALCEHAARHAVSLGFDTVTLWVLKGNEPARRFYERIGYSPDGGERVTTRLTGAPLEEVRYRKALP